MRSRAPAAQSLLWLGSMTRTILLLGFLATAAIPAVAQTPRDTTDKPQKTFFKKKDLVTAGVIVGASAATSIFDERIARWWRSPSVHGDSSRKDLADALTIVNETPLTIGAFAAYGLGRLTGNETLADVGLHTTESLVLTVGLAEAIRGPLGRRRPRDSMDDAFNFKFWGGFTDFAARSYPSIHAAVAFATATTLVGEVKIRKPGAVKYVAPVLYTAALVPGITRMYLDQHWASDIVAGTFMGAMLGSRVVTYAHTHKRSKLDRALLGAVIVPDGHGNVVVVGSFQR